MDHKPQKAGASRTAWYSYTKRVILRRLSENSRMTVTKLAKELSCSRNTVIDNIRALEQEFDLYYTLEFNRDLVGPLRKLQLLRINFGIKPEMKDLAKVFNNTDVRFLAMTEGDFDLLASVVVDDMKEYLHLTYNVLPKLHRYRPKIKIYNVVKEESGFTPIPNAIIGKMNLEPFRFDALDRQIIMLLNEDSRLSYAEIARRLKKNGRTVRYRLNKLMKSKIIRRFTVILRRLPTGLNIAMFMTPGAPTPGIYSRKLEANRHYVEIDKKLPLINNFQYIADLSGNCNSFYIACFENEHKMMKRGIDSQNEIFKEDKPVLLYAKITHLIHGYLPVRNIDLKSQLQAGLE